MKKLVAYLSLFSLLSCGGDEGFKTIEVIANNDAKIDATGKKITVGSTGYLNKTLNYTTSEGVNILLFYNGKQIELSIPDNGYYLLNAKTNDTIIGSLQVYLKPEEASRTITQDELLQRLDSLRLLVENKNVNEGNNNFFILPNTVAKISGNKNVQIVAPYHQLKFIETIEANPEVYRFYTISEIRATIKKLESLTEQR